MDAAYAVRPCTEPCEAWRRCRRAPRSHRSADPGVETERDLGDAAILDRYPLALRRVHESLRRLSDHAVLAGYQFHELLAGGIKYDLSILHPDRVDDVDHRPGYGPRRARRVGRHPLDGTDRAGHGGDE